jgi:hypothetical protein
MRKRSPREDRDDENFVTRGAVRVFEWVGWITIGLILIVFLVVGLQHAFG